MRNNLKNVSPNTILGPNFVLASLDLGGPLDDEETERWREIRENPGKHGRRFKNDSETAIRMLREGWMKWGEESEPTTICTE